MTITFATDEFDRITCLLERDKIQATATASDRQSASARMQEALTSLEANGLGECFWQEGGGQYRWVFRREGEKVRIAVLWSAGVLTGWEHVFWAECEMAPVIEQIRRGMSGLPAAAAGA